MTDPTCETCGSELDDGSDGADWEGFCPVCDDVSESTGDSENCPECGSEDFSSNEYGAFCHDCGFEE